MKRNPIASFHSQVKWKELEKLKRYFSKPINILDIAVGRGGDIFKYGDLFTINTFVGIDIDASAIDEAKTRVKENQSKLHADKVILETLDINSRKLFETVSKYETKFDLVVCNFAFHYFCHSDPEWLIKDILKLLNPSGIFWIIVPDGQKLLELYSRYNNKPILNPVYELLIEKPVLDYGTKVDYRLCNTVYFDTAKPGEKIIDSGVSHEFLVPIPKLTSMMKKNGFELVSVMHFYKYFYLKKLEPLVKEISGPNCSLVLRLT